MGIHHRKIFTGGDGVNYPQGAFAYFSQILYPIIMSEAKKQDVQCFNIKLEGQTIAEFELELQELHNKAKTNKSIDNIGKAAGDILVELLEDGATI